MTDDDPFDPGPPPYYGRCELDAHCRHYAAGTAPCCADGCGACPPGRTPLRCGHCPRVNLWAWAQATPGADLACPACGLLTRVIDASEPHYVRGRMYPGLEDIERRDIEILRLRNALWFAGHAFDHVVHSLHGRGAERTMACQDAERGQRIVREALEDDAAREKDGGT